MNPRDRFILETEEHRTPEQPEGTWSQLRCTIIEVKADGSRTRLGEFIRSYSSLMATWEPFEQGDKFYALCSPEYTGTSVMALPSCEIIAAEAPDANGFCPTGFYVPRFEKDYPSDDDESCPIEPAGMFGFVCGCVWGDDTSWKLQMLDLSRIEDGKITRTQPFGYHELPPGSLRDHVWVMDSADGRLGVQCSALSLHWLDQSTPSKSQDDATPDADDAL